MPSRPVLWVTVHLPDDPALAGKTLRVSAHLDVRYPRPAGYGKFTDVGQSLDQTDDVQLSGPGARTVAGLLRAGVFLAGPAAWLLACLARRRAGRLRAEAQGQPELDDFEVTAGDGAPPPPQSL